MKSVAMTYVDHPTDKTYTVAAPEGWKIVRGYRHQFHVHSDNAMIDSGNGYAFDLWDGHRTGYSSVHTGRDGDRHFVPPVASHTDEDLARMAAYEEALKYVGDVTNVASTALRITIGGLVRVVKGRKVPLSKLAGDYKVTNHAAGQFGPYVDLQSVVAPALAQFRFISVDNVVVVPNFDAAFNSCVRFCQDTPDGRIERNFIRKMAESNFADLTDWAVLADWVEEHERLPSSTCGHRMDNYVDPVYFAHSLRVILQDGGLPKLDTYAAERHNQFRTSRY